MKPTRTHILAAAIAVVLGAALIFKFVGGDNSKPEELTLNQFLAHVEAGEVDTATILDRSSTVEGTLADGTDYTSIYPVAFSDELTEIITGAEPAVDFDIERQAQSLWSNLFWTMAPVLLLVGVFLYFLNRMQGGAGKAAQFGKAKARKMTKDQPTVTFADVAGAEEAVDELREIRDFLQNPARFQKIGAEIPKGVLLYGPPGTGKTLLARAVAGEAGVPFFSISGSDFVEMFVGVGASRVRDLFAQAKAEAPAIVFVDEIDAVGRQRGAGMGGGHDEREQTLNQLLVEMDGFDVGSGVIMMAATNRPDILDPALLRPGRFDRQIVVDRPDIAGRKQIVEVHAKGKPIGDDIDAEIIARRTPGFTGADVANLLNEAALLTARRGLPTIGMAEIEAAVDRVIAGPERKSRMMSDKEKWVIAYHEAGHALVGHVLPNTDPIHKVSIVARGRALGWTLALPTQEKYLQSRAEMRDQMAMLLGGRTAEEVIFGDPTTGAADDIERTTKMARAMVTQFGMSDRLGPIQLGQPQGEVFVGRDTQTERNYSEDVANLIDAEVSILINAAHDEARELLTLHRPVLDRLAGALVAHESLGEAELLEIFADLEHHAIAPSIAA